MVDKKIVINGFLFLIVFGTFFWNRSYNKIEYIGNSSDKFRGVIHVNNALNKNGNFGAYGDLSPGLIAFIKEYHIIITDQESSYEVSIYPEGDMGGHDFYFIVNKLDLEISDLVVGNVLP